MTQISSITPNPIFAIKFDLLATSHLQVPTQHWALKIKLSIHPELFITPCYGQALFTCRLHCAMRVNLNSNDLTYLNVCNINNSSRVSESRVIYGKLRNINWCQNWIIVRHIIYFCIVIGTLSCITWCNWIVYVPCMKKTSLNEQIIMSNIAPPLEHFIEI
mgnify:CR=1 FL=1